MSALGAMIARISWRHYFVGLSSTSVRTDVVPQKTAVHHPCSFRPVSALPNSSKSSQFLERSFPRPRPLRPVPILYESSYFDNTAHQTAQLSCYGVFGGCLPCFGSSCWEGLFSGYVLSYLLRLWNHLRSVRSLIKWHHGGFVFNCFANWNVQASQLLHEALRHRISLCPLFLRL